MCGGGGGGGESGFILLIMLKKLKWWPYKHGVIAYILVSIEIFLLFQQSLLKCFSIISNMIPYFLSPLHA